MEAKSSTPVGRPRAFNQEQALDRAMHVFWEKGYEGASIHDLTSAMGIQPASLYAAFGNKEAMFELALAHYLAGPAAFMSAALEEPSAYAVAERILRQTAEFLTARRGRYGCMTIQAALVGGKETKGIRQNLIRLRVRSQNALRRRFEQCKSDGDLPGHVDAAGLADFITCVFQGMTVQAINGAGRDQLLRIAKTALCAWPRPIQGERELPASTSRYLPPVPSTFPATGKSTALGGSSRWFSPSSVVVTRAPGHRGRQVRSMISETVRMMNRPVDYAEATCHSSRPRPRCGALSMGHSRIRPSGFEVAEGRAGP